MDINRYIYIIYIYIYTHLWEPISTGDPTSVGTNCNKNTISKKGQMERSDLSNPPFDRIQPYHKLFKEEDVEDIMIICNTLEKRFNANK